MRKLQQSTNSKNGAKSPANGRAPSQSPTSSAAGQATAPYHMNIRSMATTQATTPYSSSSSSFPVTASQGIQQNSVTQVPKAPTPTAGPTQPLSTNPATPASTVTKSNDISLSKLFPGKDFVRVNYVPNQRIDAVHGPIRSKITADFNQSETRTGKSINNTRQFCKMEEFKKKQGKEGTRGAKQIATENSATIQFYRNMILGANGIYFTGMTLMGATYYATEMTMFLICAVIYIACYQFMARFGTPKLSPSGQLLDPGLDLNMPQGMAEHIKDIIILSAAVQVLALFSNYLWCLLLLAPARGFWMAWTNIISPWIFAPAPEEQVDDKKQRKMERKMRRNQAR